MQRLMMLTCRGAETDKVLALELGANNYIAEPFGISELITRIQALLRREDEKRVFEVPEKKELVFKDLVIDFHKKK